MLTASAAVFLGFIALIWSADRFIAGAASLAFHWGMSRLLIGLTIVAFGTSAPEILVSLFAALNGASNIAVGNALGSNLANTGLVLGITALIAAIPVKSRLIRKELPILIIVTLVAGGVLYDRIITLIDSLVLIVGLIVFLIYLSRQQKAGDSLESDAEEVDDLIQLNNKQAWFHFFGGLIVLLASSNILVWGAENIATIMGVSELVIGLTIVAVGTSLPELAASIASVRHGHHEIAFGNIIGSNIFNLLVVMAVPGFVNPELLDAMVFKRDYLAMLGMTFIWVAIMVFCSKTSKNFGRSAGTILLTLYCAYYVLLAQQL